MAVWAAGGPLEAIRVVRVEERVTKVVRVEALEGLEWPAGSYCIGLSRAKGGHSGGRGKGRRGGEGVGSRGDTHM